MADDCLFVQVVGIQILAAGQGARNSLYWIWCQNSSLLHSQCLHSRIGGVPLPQTQATYHTSQYIGDTTHYFYHNTVSIETAIVGQQKKH